METITISNLVINLKYQKVNDITFNGMKMEMYRLFHTRLNKYCYIVGKFLMDQENRFQVYLEWDSKSNSETKIPLNLK